MTKHEITGIRKPNRWSTHEHIMHVRYDNQIWTREHVIQLIAAGTDSFYVVGGGREIAVKVVRPPWPRQPFLETLPDRTMKDNLLSLPEV
jgi:hypothetical protein